MSHITGNSTPFIMIFPLSIRWQLCTLYGLRTSYWHLFRWDIRSGNIFWPGQQGGGGERHIRHVGSCDWPDGQVKSIKIPSREIFPTSFSLSSSYDIIASSFGEIYLLGALTTIIILCICSVWKFIKCLSTSLCRESRAESVRSWSGYFSHPTDKKTGGGLSAGLMKSVSGGKTEPVFRLREAGRKEASETQLWENLSSCDPQMPSLGKNHSAWRM